MASRTPAQQAAAMQAIQKHVEKNLGRPACVMMRKGDQWVMHHGNLDAEDNFTPTSETLVQVPQRHDCHCKTEFAMELFGAFLIKEARNPAPPGTYEELPPDWVEGTPIQRFALEDTVTLIICNSEGEPTLFGQVEEWKSEGQIIEGAVEQQGDANQ